MLDDLKQYFALTSNFRSSTSNIMLQSIIIKDALPALLERTTSMRLKLAIANFLKDNAHAIISSKASRRGA